MSEQKSTTNFADEVETVENPPSAENQQKPVRGRPITKENAKQYQLSAARAKKLRKEARMKMLAALTEKMDLGEELFKALHEKDESYLGMIEKATRLVGLQHDQSSEAMAQRMEIKADSNVNGHVNITVKGLDGD